jgi:hypothetical protein
MQVVQKDLNTGNYKFVKYPRNDNQPVYGLSPNIKLYGIIIDNSYAYDFKTHYIKEVEIFTDDPFPGMEHLGTYRKTYELIQLSNEQIIENLNTFVGEHIDSRYPSWEQNKHTGQLLRLLFQLGQANWTEKDLARYTWIVSTADWAKGCRLLRDQMEKDFLENGIIPNFEWSERPLKPEILK